MKKKKDILFLLISMFIMVIAWIGFSIYHNATTSTIPTQLNIQILPIAPDFDAKTVNDIKSRQRINPLYQIVPNANPTPSPTFTPTLSPTTLPVFTTPSPTATASANNATSSGALSP